MGLSEARAAYSSIHREEPHMDTWIWVILIGAGALALFALAWWSSGRSKGLGRGPQNPLTPGQTLRLDATKYGTNMQKGPKSGI
jgi:hypothetical protein